MCFGFLLPKLVIGLLYMAHPDGLIDGAMSMACYFAILLPLLEGTKPLAKSVIAWWDS